MSCTIAVYVVAFCCFASSFHASSASGLRLSAGGSPMASSLARTASGNAEQVSCFGTHTRSPPTTSARRHFVAAAGAGCDAVPYFCLHGDAYRSRGATLLQSVARQLAEAVPALGPPLRRALERHAAERSVDVLFEQLLQRPLGAVLARCLAPAGNGQRTAPRNTCVWCQVRLRSAPSELTQTDVCSSL